MQNTINIDNLKQYFSILSHDINSYLIDVRTMHEWQNVGIPDVPNLILLEWRLAKNMQINPNFYSELQQKIPDKNAKLFFICRSGGRSQEAVEHILAQGEYCNCINIVNGFEGFDSNIGWKNANLPWRFYNAE